VNPTDEEVLKFLSHPWIEEETHCFVVMETSDGLHGIFDGRTFACPFQDEQPEDKTIRVNWNYRHLLILSTVYQPRYFWAIKSQPFLNQSLATWDAIFFQCLELCYSLQQHRVKAD
jgi:hypothetical protein